jgi:flagellar biosynthesis protein FlhB
MTQRKVVGIGFGPDASVPSVVLKASGADAESVLARAQSEVQVPTVHMPELADRLYRRAIDAPIDKELFPVMAALLVQVMKSDRLQGEQKK